MNPLNNLAADTAFFCQLVGEDGRALNYSAKLPFVDDEVRLEVLVVKRQFYHLYRMLKSKYYAIKGNRPLHGLQIAEDYWFYNDFLLFL